MWNNIYILLAVVIHTLILRTKLPVDDTSLHVRDYMTSGCNWEVTLSQEYVLSFSRCS